MKSNNKIDSLEKKKRSTIKLLNSRFFKKRKGKEKHQKAVEKFYKKQAITGN